MKLMPHPFCLILLLTLLVSACAETRFGEEVKRDPQGELPPLPVTAITDQQADTLYMALLEEPLLTEDEQKKASEEEKATIPIWDKAREDLKRLALKPTKNRRSHQRRLGRLKHMIAEDKTDVRKLVLKYWLILYKDLEGAEAQTAVDVLQDKILAETDLAATFHLTWLATMVMGDDVKATYTEEHRAGLARMDKYYRTGDKKALETDTADQPKQSLPPER